MMKKARIREAAKAAIRASQLAAAVTVGRAGIPAAAAASFDIIELVRGLMEESNRRKVQELLDEAYFANAPDAGAAANFHALLQDAKFRRVLVETVRAKLEALADEVTPVLAMLMREYERTGQEPDWFFRGFCRVLQDLSPEEFVELREFLGSLVRALANDREAAWLVVAANDQDARVEVIIPLSGGSVNSYSTLTHLTVGSHTNRLLRLMTTSGVGTVSQRDAELRWRVEQALLLRVHRFLDPASAW